MSVHVTATVTKFMWRNKILIPCVLFTASVIMMVKILRHQAPDGAKQPVEYLETIDFPDGGDRKLGRNQLSWNDMERVDQNVLFRDIYKDFRQKGKETFEGQDHYVEAKGEGQVEVVEGYEREAWGARTYDPLSLLQDQLPHAPMVDLETIDDYVIKASEVGKGKVKAQEPSWHSSKEVKIVPKVSWQGLFSIKSEEFIDTKKSLEKSPPKETYNVYDAEMKRRKDKKADESKHLRMKPRDGDYWREQEQAAIQTNEILNVPHLSVDKTGEYSNPKKKTSPMHVKTQKHVFSREEKQKEYNENLDKDLDEMTRKAKRMGKRKTQSKFQKQNGGRSYSRNPIQSSYVLKQSSAAVIGDLYSPIQNPSQEQRKLRNPSMTLQFSLAEGHKFLNPAAHQPLPLGTNIQHLNFEDKTLRVNIPRQNPFNSQQLVQRDTGHPGILSSNKDQVGHISRNNALTGQNMPAVLFQQQVPLDHRNSVHARNGMKVEGYQQLPPLQIDQVQHKQTQQQSTNKQQQQDGGNAQRQNTHSTQHGQQIKGKNQQQRSSDFAKQRPGPDQNFQQNLHLPPRKPAQPLHVIPWEQPTNSRGAHQQHLENQDLQANQLAFRQVHKFQQPNRQSLAKSEVRQFDSVHQPLQRTNLANKETSVVTYQFEPGRQNLRPRSDLHHQGSKGPQFRDVEQNRDLSKQKRKSSSLQADPINRFEPSPGIKVSETKLPTKTQHQVQGNSKLTNTRPMLRNAQDRVHQQNQFLPDQDRHGDNAVPLPGQHRADGGDSPSHQQSLHRSHKAGQQAYKKPLLSQNERPGNPSLHPDTKLQVAKSDDANRVLHKQNRVAAPFPSLSSLISQQNLMLDVQKEISEQYARIQNLQSKLAIANYVAKEMTHKPHQLPKDTIQPNEHPPRVKGQGHEIMRGHNNKLVPTHRRNETARVEPDQGKVQAEQAVYFPQHKGHQSLEGNKHKPSWIGNRTDGAGIAKSDELQEKKVHGDGAGDGKNGVGFNAVNNSVNFTGAFALKHKRKPTNLSQQNKTRLYSFRTHFNDSIFDFGGNWSATNNDTLNFIMFPSLDLVGIRQKLQKLSNQVSDTGKFTRHLSRALYRDVRSHLDLFSQWEDGKEALCPESNVITAYDDKFARLHHVTVDKKYSEGKAGGENISDVINQSESSEYYKVRFGK